MPVTVRRRGERQANHDRGPGWGRQDDAGARPDRRAWRTHGTPAPPPKLLREPGGVELSERIRELVKDPAMRVGARAEALLYAAAKAQLVEELVTPLLAAGTTVVLDRFVDSSLAYQGAARGLGIEAEEQSTRWPQAAEPRAHAAAARVPHNGRERQSERGREPDRLEREGNDFFAAIAAHTTNWPEQNRGESARSMRSSRRSRY